MMPCELPIFLTLFLGIDSGTHRRQYDRTAFVNANDDLVSHLEPRQVHQGDIEDDAL